MSELVDYQNILAEDPGNPVFAEYADSLRRRKQFAEAFEVCFKGLSVNPACHLGRLILARAFYDCNHLSFAVREVNHLCNECPDLPALKRLLSALSPDAEPNIDRAPTAQEESSVEEEIVAETDFDFEELELIEDENENNK
ncbi:MAG: hypothetical protein KDD42_05680 [Bdellovibrionales bacterium]|nr:hypothetical protein [Bdellovibrionales bacterium]